MVKALKFKLYSSNKNAKLHKQIEYAGIIFNHVIRLHKKYFKQYGRGLSEGLCKKYIAKRRRTNAPEWKVLGSQAIQDVIERIYKGWAKFFRKDNKRPPTFRKREKFQSFTLKQAGWALLGGNQLRIGTTIYKFCLSRPVEGKVKTVTIKRNALGELFVFFVVQTGDVSIHRVKTGRTAGFDFGLKTFLVGSDGTRIYAPLPLKAAMNDLRKASKAHSRTKRGSGHR